MVITLFLLFALVFGKETWAEGYHWVRSQIKGNHEILSNQIKIDQSVKHHKSKKVYSSIKLLKDFNKNVAEARSIAATNTYFMYVLEKHLNVSKDYADIDVKTSRYNSKALVNKFKFLFIKINFTRSK